MCCVQNYGDYLGCCTDFYTVTNKLLRASQHVFLPGRSTVTYMLEYLETLTRCIDEGRSFDVLYCDFAKAFDKVP